MDIIRPTVNNWLKKYSNWKEDNFIKQRISKEIKRQTVRHIEQGLLTKKDAAKKFKIDYSTITTWVKQYSCGVKINTKIMQEITEEGNHASTLIKQENGSKLIVDELKLKIAALETMIDVAESELNIEIRKKSGTKQ